MGELGVLATDEEPYEESKEKRIKEHDQTTGLLSYIKYVVDQTARCLQPQGTTVSHMYFQTMRRLVSRLRRQLKVDDRRNVIYGIK